MHKASVLIPDALTSQKIEKRIWGSIASGVCLTCARFGSPALRREGGREEEGEKGRKADMLACRCTIVQCSDARL